MSIFELYLKLGYHHIVEFAAFDHILFLVALSAVYTLKDWKHVLILITAFTIGHSITLALATLRVIIIGAKLVEFLIAVTILLSALANIFYKGNQFSKKLHLYKYLMALFFGLVHGLGFSDYLLSLLGKEQSIVEPLLAFNLGVEGGQLVIDVVILSLTTLLVEKLKAPKREVNLTLSGMALGVSLILIVERFPF